jgi:chorismate dehydratase
LGGEWKAMTGLPFVFAVWAAVKPMNKEWIHQFNAANALGLTQLDAIAEAQKYSAFDLKNYYFHHIAYHLTPERMKGLERFLEMLKF